MSSRVLVRRVAMLILQNSRGYRNQSLLAALALPDHPATSMWLIILTAAIHLLMVVIRFEVFVPTHRRLDKAKSMELINRLLRYDI